MLMTLYDDNVNGRREIVDAYAFWAYPLSRFDGIAFATSGSTLNCMRSRSLPSELALFTSREICRFFLATSC